MVVVYYNYISITFIFALFIYAHTHNFFFISSSKYKTATSDDLWHHLTRVAHMDGTLSRNMSVKTLMNTWTLQIGYPVVKVVRSPDGTSANVTQVRQNILFIQRFMQPRDILL